MPHYLQFKIRTFLISVVVLAPTLLVPRYFYHRQLAQAKYDQGAAEIQTYRTIAPSAFSATQWNSAVDEVVRRWGRQFAAGRVPEGVSDEIMRQVRTTIARSNETLAEGDLYAIYDLIENADLRHAGRRNAPPEVPSVGGCYRISQWEFDPLELSDSDSLDSKTGVVAYALAGVSATTDPMVALAAEVAKNPDWRRRAMARRALRVLARKLSRDDAIPVFIQALDDREDVVRKIAMGALAGWGRTADAALPKLELTMANDPSARLRSLAGYAFDEVAPRERRRPVMDW